MGVWFAGSFSIGDVFTLAKSEGPSPFYSLDLGGKVYAVTEDFERQAKDPSKGTQCFRTEAGLFLFPWNWGHNSNNWPRFEGTDGQVHLIRLQIERGNAVDFSLEHAKWMETIRKLLIKDAKRQMPPQLRVVK